MPKFKINKLFVPALTNKCRYVDLWGGRGRGGSYHAVSHAMMNIVKPEYYRGLFVRKVLHDIKGSLFQDFKDLIVKCGFDENEFYLNENEYIVKYKESKNFIISKGTKAEGDRTAKNKSLPSITTAYIDEADELSESEFDQLDLSIRTELGTNQIFRVFNPPPKNHWIWRDYILLPSEIEGYYKAVLKSNPDHYSLFSTYIDNYNNLNEAAIRKYEHFLKTNPEYYYTIIKGLVSEGKKGRIYTHFLPITDAEYEKIQASKVYIIDFGYSSDPTCVLEVKKVGQIRYCRELIYTNKLDNLELAKLLIDKGITYRDRIYCDYGAGGDVRIADLIRGYKGIEGYEILSKGFNAIPVRKGNNSIAVGISLVKSKQWYITESSVNVWNEAGSYSWALDREKIPTDNPIDKDNHAMDCIRYFELIVDFI